MGVNKLVANYKTSFCCSTTNFVDFFSVTQKWGFSTIAMWKYYKGLNVKFVIEFGAVRKVLRKPTFESESYGLKKIIF